MSIDTTVYLENHHDSCALKRFRNVTTIFGRIIIFNQNVFLPFYQNIVEWFNEFVTTARQV
jgi:hypothetical protein